VNPLSALRKLDHSLSRKATSLRSRRLDETLIPLSRAADHSLLWLGIAALMAVAGGRFGRRAALRGVLSLGLTSALVNGPLKMIARRGRPEPDRGLTTPLHRTPRTASFPSGHAASAFAFATGAVLESPALGAPLGVAAAAVAASRVYAGVHYPADVLAGSLVGAAVAVGTTRFWPLTSHKPAKVRPGLTRVDTESFPEGDGITFVVNPTAGPAFMPNPAHALREALPLARVIETGEDLDMEDALKMAAAEARAIGIAGGDGSVNGAAEEALAHNLPLVVVPTGTLNHLARDLGLDSVKDSVEAVQHGHAAAVDIGTIDGKPFLNTASFGSYVELVDAREKLERRIGKWPAVLVALVKVLRASEPVKVEINGEVLQVWMIFIGNCAYRPQGFAPSWRERLDDGLLDVRIVDGRHPWSRARLVLALLTGRLGRCKVYDASLVRRLDVRFLDPGPVRLARDGETFEGSRHFKVEKKRPALNIYVPRA
jgi:diacylglycerol kinase family enzyme/membrane-associated phospholipid phosphatase